MHARIFTHTYTITRAYIHPCKLSHTCVHMEIDAPIDASLCIVVVFIAVECLTSRMGLEFKGMTSRTSTGIKCMPWNTGWVSR